MGTAAGVVGRRWWLLVLPLLVLAATATGILARRSTTYEAVATIRTGGNPVLAVTSGSAADGTADLVADARTMLQSQEFLADVAALATVDRVDGEFEVRPDGPRLVEVIYVADDAETAGRVAGAAIELLLRARRDRVAEAGERAVALLRDRLARAEAAMAEAEDALAAFDRRHPAPAPSDPPLSRSVAAEGNRLAAEVEHRQEAMERALVALDDAEVAAEVALAGATSERLVDRPPRPDDGRWPLLPIALVVVLLGGGIGVGLALLAERRDHTVRDEIDVQDATPGVPVLAVIDAP